MHDIASHSQTNPSAKDQKMMMTEVANDFFFFPFGEQWYILERFPLHSEATRLPLMEKSRMYLSRASRVSSQDNPSYVINVPSPPQGSQPSGPGLGSAPASANEGECRSGYDGSDAVMQRASLLPELVP